MVNLKKIVKSRNSKFQKSKNSPFVRLIEKKIKGNAHNTLSIL